MTNLIEIESFLHEHNVNSITTPRVSKGFMCSVDDEEHTVFTKKIDQVNVVIIKIKFSDNKGWYYDSSYTDAYLEVLTDQDRNELNNDIIEFNNDLI